MFISRLSSEPYALMMAGQASDWRGVLTDLTQESWIGDHVSELIAASDKQVAPIAAQLAAIGGAALTTETLQASNEPVCSVPGITAAQYGLLHTAASVGFDIAARPPVSIIGHSQGVLGAAMAEAWGDTEKVVTVFSLSRLIGAATSRACRAAGISTSAMMSVRGLPRQLLETLVTGDSAIAIRNAHRHYVLSGRPADLAKVSEAIELAVAADRAELAAKERGGAPLSPIIDDLDVLAPFHHQLLEGALAQVLTWAHECGLTDVESLARAVLTEPVDWPAQVAAARQAGANLFIDLGPGTTLTKITSGILDGTGATVVSAGTVDLIDEMTAGGFDPAPLTDWSVFAPRLLDLPGGPKLDTKFSRLTGYSPILLPGMTPTTVDPQIVAAAANKGYWAELAGGGQVTAEVFAENLASLKDQLDPGRAAQFNAMFMDRYLWNLQFGSSRVVSKARESGAPLNGVVISAGIPEVEEAPALIRDLRGQGFSYVAFKPGTVAQIRQVLAIARQVDTPVIMHVEDGHAGGHHSWENLDDLLRATYALIRREDNVVLCVGGGIGTPERAAEYMTGRWSLAYDLPAMPVDGVFIGTAAMTAAEAKTSRAVKELLVATKGVDPSDNDGWVGAGRSRGGVTSGLSHLRADMYEIDNDAAACARLIAEVESKPELLKARRAEIIEALNKTAKPFFGELDEMTYAEVVRRFADLSYPWVDPSWLQRYHELLQRVEARLNPADTGTVPTLFPDLDSAADAHGAADALVEAYPTSVHDTLTPADVAWFVSLCRKYPKPMGFVPRIDDDLLRWWGQDSLWQSQDERYEANACRIIPGPVSVAGITTIDEPIGDLLGRFEQTSINALVEAGTKPVPAYARMDAASDARALIQAAPFISWTGHLMDNPAHTLDESQYTLTIDGDHATLEISLDTYWDGGPADVHAVRTLTIPLLLPESVRTGGVPVVDEARLPETMVALLSGTAGVGNTSVTGQYIEALPEMVASTRSAFGQAHYSFTVTENLGADHTAVTGAALANHATFVPDALLGPCWPAIYAALGSATVDGYPVIEGLLNAVHLDHRVALETAIEPGTTVDVISWAASVAESSSGRIVEVDLDLSVDGVTVGSMVERFAIRGRAHGTSAPADPAPAGGRDVSVTDTPRSTLAKVSATAPANMTPFAWVSGDFNPIHTSANAATVAGLAAPLVHGMWLSATAQHAATAASGELTGWTYRMYSMVGLGDTVDITVERVGHIDGGGHLLEVTCRVEGELVSQASASTAAPVTAYVYPGQGIQSPGMGLAERANSAATAATWDRADRFTRDKLGFSIIALVRDNPTVLEARGHTYRHPEGVLNLTQFTQVALATLAFAQTERLREAGALRPRAYLAGHSLGEYNALAAYASVIPLETVLEVVFHRGSTMHNLVPRDEQGRSNYRMGALRPNQFGVGDDQIVDYVEQVSAESGEFLEIVNFNLKGAQYAIAGTVAGLEALAADAAQRAEKAGGKAPFMLVPGIDVPFHSRVLHSGVDEFREKLEELLPQTIDGEALIGTYIPNLVAIPFELTRDFVQAILDVVPSDPMTKVLENWEAASADTAELTRTILIELLCWQFACPVRWIETQDYLFASTELDEFIEVGLGNAPTLANLAAKTLALPSYTRPVAVRNVQRDEQVVYSRDVAIIDDTPVQPETAAEQTTPEAAAAEPASVPEPAAVPDPVPTPVPEPAAAQQASGPAPDLPYRASDAILTLLAYSTKVRPDQIGGADTVGTLTNGVSSRLNQLLMDFSSELSLPSVEGAAEADINTLSATVNRAAHNYTPFGPVLTEAIKDSLRKVLGAGGLKLSAINERVTGTWQLPDGWVAHVTAEMLLGTRTGASTRGGDLATLPTEVTGPADVTAMIDAAVRAVGTAHDHVPTLPTKGGSASASVDSAALDEFAARIIGQDGVLASTARHLLSALELTDTSCQIEELDDDGLAEAVSAELGSSWLSLVAPAFDPAKAVLLDDRWASAREDLARIWAGIDLPETTSFAGTGEHVATQARWWAAKAAQSRPELESRYTAIAKEAMEGEGGAFAGQVAVVTGMAPTSIAGGVVASLLTEGATVVATASSITAARLAYAKDLYRSHARGGAALWLVPANLSSYRDVDALVEWIGSEQSVTVGSDHVVTKEAFVPDLYFPFAAPKVTGSVADAGPAAENQARLLLWSVQRSMTALAALGSDTHIDHRLHVVLPGSPNRGTFGGDGAYGEAKASFDAILNKWKVEPWAERVTLAHPRIGWVAGTGLMGGNDPLIGAAQEAGIRIWSPDEIATELLELATPEARAQAALAPVDKDLTGGLGDINIAALRREASIPEEDTDTGDTSISALPSPVRVGIPQASWPQVTTPVEDMIVVVGLGEVGPWGHGRTRLEAEYGITSDGQVDLTPAGVLELAWMTGLLTWRDTPIAGWYDSDDQVVPEEEIFERYRDEVVARSGVRTFIDEAAINDLASPKEVEVFLDQDVTFGVDSKEEALSLVAADPAFTTAHEVEGGWQVTRKAGARSRVPKKATLARKVGGQFPTDFDPTRWGIPASLVESIDRIAVWNLVATVDAYVSAGFTPAEILENVHPAQVAMTQGTGFGGMTSMRKLFVDRFLDEAIPSDILQETLPNVVAAHTMQNYVGGYGAMIHPVGACATAAVSVEEGVDKIALGKADFVVAGAIDDISVESITGFASMNATADSDVMAGKGINERFYSRPNDRRRGGFVESQGGGTVLLARGSLAAQMGLPVHAVVGYAQSFADGAHTSIPAPGLGALAAGRGGTGSALATKLADLGVSADDITVVSKHDTSTNANDPNESELHTRLARSMGRTEGNPLFVVSQKALTGHAKGGAAVFQMAGLINMFTTSTIPANASLDCVDPELAENPELVWLTRPLPTEVKAGLLTSLGFGHVSALVALVHPAAFYQCLAQVDADRAKRWLERATARLRSGRRRLESGMLGHTALFTPIESRRLGDDGHEVEAAMLLNPDARLDDTGFYR